MAQCVRHEFLARAASRPSRVTRRWGYLAACAAVLAMGAGPVRAATVAAHHHAHAAATKAATSLGHAHVHGAARTAKTAEKRLKRPRMRQAVTTMRQRLPPVLAQAPWRVWGLLRLARPIRPPPRHHLPPGRCRGTRAR
ncbi:hypothetical protein [Komagataeibacter nataicola]|uniref:hypothetical protein n=1 Tax=Komagataeibacter nataicola TaxID=265960 RepID=UPI0038D1D0E1